MKILILFFFGWSRLFCESHLARGLSEFEKPRTVISAEDSTRLAEYIQEKNESLRYMDTTTPRGNFVRFTMAKDCTVAVIWGNRTFQRIFFPGWSADFYTGSFWQETQHSLLLTQHCGCPCWRDYALPLDDSSAVVGGHMTLSVDRQRDRVLALSDPESGADSLWLINLRTGKKIPVMPDSLMNFVNPMNALTLVKFSADGVFLRWERWFRPGENSDEPKYKEKFFSCKF